MHMGTIIPFRAHEERHTPGNTGNTSSSVDLNALVAELQTFAADIATTLETAETVTACFQYYEVSPVQSARASAYLHNLLQRVRELYRLVEPLSQLAANSYPVLIQAHHVATLLEQAIRAVREAREQKGNACQYLSAWRAAHLRVRAYPLQGTELVEAISHYCQELVSHALQ